jgi:hypothetical protein
MRTIWRAIVCLIVGLFVIISFNPILIAENDLKQSDVIQNIFNELKSDLEMVKSRDDILVLYEDTLIDLYDSGFIDEKTKNSFIILMERTDLSKQILISGEILNSQILSRGITSQILLLTLYDYFYHNEILRNIFEIIILGGMITYPIKEQILNVFPLMIHRDIAFGSTYTVMGGDMWIERTDPAKGWVLAEFKNGTINNYTGSFIGDIEEISIPFIGMSLPGPFAYHIGITGFTGISIKIEHNWPKHKIYFIGYANNYEIKEA